MTELQLVFWIPDVYSDTLKDIQNDFSNFSPELVLEHETIHFKTDINLGEAVDLTERLENYEKILRSEPDNSYILEQYKRISMLDIKETYPDAKICLSATLPYTVNEEKNTLIHDDYSKIRASDPEYEQKTMGMYYYFDDFNLSEIVCMCLAILSSICLACPYIDIGYDTPKVFWDGKLCKENWDLPFFLQSNLEKVYQRFPELYTEKLSLTKAFNWISTHTDLISYEKKQNIAFTSLLYSLSRGTYESLLHSIIGLEHIFVPKQNEKGISYLLQKRLKAVFPQLQLDEIKKMYKLRSDFVHGNRTMQGYPSLYDQYVDNEKDVIDASIYGVALLIASLRELIIHNSKSFQFSENISYQLISE